MRVNVLLFARLKEIAGAERLEREVGDGATLASVWDGLAREHPGLERYTSSISGAINAEYARMTSPVRDGDELAFLPPVSGGSQVDDLVTWRSPDPRTGAKSDRRSSDSEIRNV